MNVVSNYDKIESESDGEVTACNNDCWRLRPKLKVKAIDGSRKPVVSNWVPYVLVHAWPMSCEDIAIQCKKGRIPFVTRTWEQSLDPVHDSWKTENLHTRRVSFWLQLEGERNLSPSRWYQFNDKMIVVRLANFFMSNNALQVVGRMPKWALCSTTVHTLQRFSEIVPGQ